MVLIFYLKVCALELIFYLNNIKYIDVIYDIALIFYLEFVLWKLYLYKWYCHEIIFLKSVYIFPL